MAVDQYGVSDQASTPDPFTSSGGGVYAQKYGGWLPSSHPLAQKYLSEQGAAAPGGAPADATANAAGGQTTIPGQAQAASTYSQTPGAAPGPNATNQGTQDVVRNSYLAQATQPTTIDTRDPAFRQQADNYSANIERQRRGAVADAAEANGPYATGALQGIDRRSKEVAGQASAGFESELLGKELTNRRAEIQTALDQLRGMGQNDQTNALQTKLAELDAQIKRMGIESDSASAAAERALKEYLGTAGINVDLLRLAQDDSHFGDQLGLDTADKEAYYNNEALKRALGM